jgi:hypothetical protein
MLGLPILDVAIGVIFTYIVLSLVVTTANELIASLLRRRQQVLWEGIRNLLADEALATKLYEHPLIASLKRKNLRPSYIPSRTFTLALLDTVAPITSGSMDIDARLKQLQISLAGQQAALPPSVSKTLLILLSEAGQNLENFKKQVEGWFNESMDRVSGWYKRGTQAILLVLSILLTIGSNADTLNIMNTLWRDPAVRAAAVAEAQSYVANASNEPQGADEQQQFQAALNRLNTMPVPMGWTPCAVGQECSSIPGAWPGLNATSWGTAIANHWLGWTLTALAISIGAPFWFDLLNKVVAIRSSGKTPEKAAAEAKAADGEQT